MQRGFQSMLPSEVIQRREQMQRPERHMDGQREFFQLPTGRCHCGTRFSVGSSHAIPH